MIALRARCCGVTSSDVLMDHLLDNYGEVFDDGCFERRWQPRPERFGGDGHSASHWLACVTNSVTAASVSLAPGVCPGRANEVALNAIRSRM